MPHDSGPLNDELIRLKELGNQAFKQGDLQAAICLYTQGIDLVASEEPKEIKLVLSQLYSNRAAVRLQMGAFQIALDDSKRSIELDGSNKKGYYRAAKASMNLGLTHDSCEFCEAGLSVDPSNTDLHDLLSACKHQLTLKAGGVPLFASDEDTRACYERFKQLEEQCAVLSQRIGTREFEAARFDRTSSVIKEMVGVTVYKSFGRSFVKDSQSKIVSELNEKSSHCRKESQFMRDNLVALKTRKDATENELKALLGSE